VRIGGLLTGFDQPVCIVGVINLSPESFYSGSVAADKASLIKTVQEMEEECADMLDIGGASTAPKQTYGTESVSEQEELKRVCEAMKILDKITDLPISVDTVNVSVAETALDLGAAVVNDVNGLRGESSMARLVAEREVPVVVMANCTPPCQSVDASLDSLKESLRIADEAGIPSERVITDPGIGFGKPPVLDLALLRDLPRFTKLGHPVLVGVSRKAFIGKLLDVPDPEDRLAGTIAATALAVANGASLVRAHDVREAHIAAKVGLALRRDKQV
jgi:dihydropteroate synthase